MREKFDQNALSRTVEKVPHRRSYQEIKEDVVEGRRNLALTLDAIEHKLNVPKRTYLQARRLAYRLRLLREQNPTIFAAGIAVTVTVLGGTVWLASRVMRNR